MVSTTHADRRVWVKKSANASTETVTPKEEPNIDGGLDKIDGEKGSDDICGNSDADKL